MYILIYNPLSKNNQGKIVLNKVIEKLGDKEYQVFSVLDYPNGFSFLKDCSANADILIVGGDGTLSRFINENRDLPQRILFYAGGTGNDFMRMFDSVKNTDYFVYSKNVDGVYLDCNNQNIKVLNVFGVGIDGLIIKNYSMKKNPTKLAYTLTTIKAFFQYQPTNVQVTIDGVEKSFEKCYLLSIGNGAYIGGGMKICPEAIVNDGLLDICIIHDVSRLKLLLNFRFVFSGNHVSKLKDSCFYAKAKTIVYHSDDARYLQYDGELINNKVTDFEVNIKND